MQAKPLYLLAEFDGETQKTLAEYFEVLSQNGFVGSQTKDIPYHFTLGSRGVEFENQLLDALEKICPETAAVDVNLDHIGLFGLNVLFIAPGMNCELLKLQRSFFPDCDCDDDCSAWTAHATLLIDEPEIILRALPLVAKNFKPMKARIESVAICEFFPARLIARYFLR